MYGTATVKSAANESAAIGVAEFARIQMVRLNSGEFSYDCRRRQESHTLIANSTSRHSDLTENPASCGIFAGFSGNGTNDSGQTRQGKQNRGLPAHVDLNRPVSAVPLDFQRNCSSIVRLFLHEPT